MGLRRAAHVAWRRVGDETVIIHLRNKRIYVLNSSGGFFWHGLDGARGPDEFLEGLGRKASLPDDAPGTSRVLPARTFRSPISSMPPARRMRPARRFRSFPFPHSCPPSWSGNRSSGTSVSAAPSWAAPSDPCNAAPTT